MNGKLVYKSIIAISALSCLLLFGIIIFTDDAKRTMALSSHGERTYVEKKFGFRNILNENSKTMDLNEVESMMPISTKHRETTMNPPSYRTSYPPKERKMKAIVIVAGFRTGSSFVGQLFNQHPNVFYLFEPLFYSIWNRNVSTTAKVMEDLLMCNMTSLVAENKNSLLKTIANYKETRTYRMKKHIHEMGTCMKKGICFRPKSKALCTPEMCHNITADNCHYCFAPSKDMMERACREASVRVIKVIRISDLDELKRSWTNEKIDLKIVHLVRDPRSTSLSRRRLSKTSGDLASLVKATCIKNALNHGHYVNNDQKYKWLKGIYKLIRYEDSLDNPELFMRDVYKFINFESLPVHNDVITWIRNSTKNSKGNQFSTSRDTNRQKSDWRFRITMNDVSSIQTVCKPMMSLLGYRLVHSEKELHNRNISLIVDEFPR